MLSSNEVLSSGNKLWVLTDWWWYDKAKFCRDEHSINGCVMARQGDAWRWGISFANYTTVSSGPSDEFSNIINKVTENNMRFASSRLSLIRIRDFIYMVH